jgi:hypothetical protein
VQQWAVHLREGVQVFIPYSSIQTMKVVSVMEGRAILEVVSVELQTGDTLQMILGDQTAKVYQRLDRLRHLCLSSQCEDAEAFCRRERTVTDWLDALRSLDSTLPPAYRSSPVTVEPMWRILEAPGAPPTARCGAAVALRQHLNEAGRKRMRSVARKAVAPGLRAALEAAADGTEAALAYALAKVDDRGMRVLDPVSNDAFLSHANTLRLDNAPGESLKPYPSTSNRSQR